MQKEDFPLKRELNSLTIDLCYEQGEDREDKT